MLQTRSALFGGSQTLSDSRAHSALSDAGFFKKDLPVELTPGEGIDLAPLKLQFTTKCNLLLSSAHHIHEMYDEMSPSQLEFAIMDTWLIHGMHVCTAER